MFFVKGTFQCKVKQFQKGRNLLYKLCAYLHCPCLIIQINQLMADSPNLSQRKNTNERSSNLPRRTSEYQNSPFSYEESEARSTYPNMQPHLQEKKIFGFEIYVDNDILSELGIIQEWFQRLASTHGVEHIGFNSDLTIPDLNGRNIQIYDVQMQKKYQCSKAMLSDIYQSFKKNKKEAFSVIIFVPEGMVSLLIGAKGHQINKIMKESHTTIVVNQPINRMTYRTAKIQGYHSDIAKACRIIYQMLQQKSSIAYSIQKQPSQLDYTKSKIKSKFIFTDQLVSFLQKRKKKLLQKVEEETKCSIKFQSQKDNRLLKKQESVCILNGRLEDVQSMVVMVINISHDFLSEEKRNIDYTLKMLIPANYVTKLIGQKGYMIRDIIERSGGAQIKILSDKQEKDRECIISINGTKENKIDAACFIMEQIECFKNGGPILQSGKSINQNLAQQFKNSLPLNSLPIKQEGEKDAATLQIVQSQVIAATQPAQVITVQQLTPLLTQTKQNAEINVSVVTNHSPMKVKVNHMEGQGSQEQGLIEVQEDEKAKQQHEKQNREQLQKQKKIVMEKEIQRLNTHKKERQHSRRSRSHSNSESNSKSRSRDKKKSKKMQFSRKLRSESESVEYKHEREIVQVKVVVPKRLGQDHKQLKYIQSLCKSTLLISEQKLQNGQVMITVRGTMKDNCRCIQLLQKRLVRFKSSTSSSAR